MCSGEGAIPTNFRSPKEVEPPVAETKLSFLFVSSSAPLPAVTGGNQRTNLLIRALQLLGTVNLVLLQQLDRECSGLRQQLQEEFGLIEEVKPTLRRHVGRWAIFAPIAPRLVSRLAHNLGRRSIDYSADPAVSGSVRGLLGEGGYDFVVSRHLSTAGKAGLIGQKGLIVDIDDFESEVYESRIRALPRGRWERLILASHARQLRRIESSMVRHTDLVWVAKASDTIRASPSRVAMVPNIPFGLYDGSLFAMEEDFDSKVVLVVASFYHPPNARGLTRFLREVWLRILDSVPEASLRVVGRGMPSALLALCESTRGVRVLGFVHDLSDQYRSAAIAIAPVYDGSGTNIKSLEALAAGRVCVTPEHGARGHLDHLGFLPGLQIARTDDEYAQIAIDLLLDPEKRASMSADTARRVASECSFEGFRTAVLESITPLIRGR